MGAGAAALGGTGLLTGIYAGNKAASAERGAYGAAADDIRSGKSEALNYQQPYSNFGQQALSPLSALLFGKSYDSTNGNFSDISPDDRMSNFLQSPGYQFRLSEGLKAIEKSQAARGGLLSGGAMKELGAYSQGLASDEYGNYLNSLFQAAGIGQNAANNQSNIATGAANSLSNTSLGAGMANANKYANLSNFGYGVGGMGLGSMMSPQGSGASGAGNAGSGGRYNPSYFQNSGIASMFGGG
jgi:hypothetical protein